MIYIIPRALCGIVATVLGVFLGLSFSQKLRSKYRFLRWSDGTKRLWLFVLFVVCVCAFYGTGVLRSLVVDPLSRQVGFLKPKQDRGTNVGANSFRFDASSQIIHVNLSSGTTIQPLGENVPLSLTVAEKGLLISMMVYDIEGKIVGEIRNNEWTLNPNNYFRKNFDRSALEVLDSHNIPVLQVEYLNRNTIMIGGLFRGESAPVWDLYPGFPSASKDWRGSCALGVNEGFITIGENGLRLMAGKPSGAQLREFVVTARKTLRPWFDYSDARTLGVRSGLD